jgi:hypothetical protein
MIITVKSHVLAAVQAACAENDLRWYLTGWCLDTADPEQAWIVGTSGSAMLAAPVATIRNDDRPSDPKTIFEPIKVARTKEPHDMLIDTRTMAATARGKEQPLTMINGSFPDWAKLLDGFEKKAGDGHPQRFMGFDVQVLSPIAKALSTTDKRAICRLVFGPRSDDGVIVKWGGSIEANNVRCVWMPCRL